VLWQVEAARRAGLEWLYLGYAIEGCRKMQYKSCYRPQERLRAGRWERVP
jgi:arginyl-tRNA--protein-N-Asp/Glu arginylyltransferase